MTTFALIQTRFERIDPEDLCDALVSHGGMTHADASRSAHRDRGILGGGFSESQATAIVKELSIRGYEVGVVPANSLPHLGKPRIIHWCEFTDEALNIPEGLKGETTSIDWLSIRVINAGLVAEFEATATPEYLPGTLSVVGPRDSAEKGSPAWEQHSHYLSVVDLIAMTETGRLIYLRLPAHELLYQRIIGDCVGMQLFERFHKVLEQLIQRSTHAMVPPDARKMLVRRMGESHVLSSDLRHFAETHEFEQYDQWLLTMALRKRSSDQPPT